MSIFGFVGGVLVGVVVGAECVVWGVVDVVVCLFLSFFIFIMFEAFKTKDLDIV